MKKIQRNGESIYEVHEWIRIIYEFYADQKKSHCIYSGQSAVTVTSYLLNITVIVSLRSAQKRYSHSAGYRLSFNNSLTAASSPFTVNGYIGNTCFTISTVLDV